MQGAGAAWLRADAALASVRERLTAGQRWTSGIAVAVAGAVLLCGLPADVVRGAAALGALAGPLAPQSAAAVGTPTTGQPAVGPGQGAALPPRAGAAGTASLPAVVPPADASMGPPSLRAVALVRSGDGPPGRDDAGIAAAFVDSAGFPITTVQLGSEPAATCAAVTRAGSVALAGSTLAPALRDCLIGRGVTVLSYDETGTTMPTSQGGRLLSTRVGEAAALLDLANWGLRDGALRGKVGIVAAADRKATLAPALAAVKAAGVHVVATVWSSGDVNVTDALSLQQAGATTVVLAAPVAAQRSLLAGAALVGYRPSYVVADVADAVADESYPPTFDGAVARTTLRVPWQARADGSTREQTRCDDLWHRKATPPVTLPGEQVRVYAWCEAVSALGAAERAAAVTGLDPAAALARMRLPSPLTLDLGPTGAGWGPSRRAVLVWHSTCACWSERSPATAGA